MQRFAIIVTLKLKPGSAEAFKPLILENATASVREEDECHQFHVLQNNENPDTFHFYEVYTSQESLENHREQPHYQKFFEAAQEFVEDRNIQFVTVQNPENTAATLGG